MISIFFTSVTGRLALIFLGVDIILPYLLRRTRFSVFLGVAPRSGSTYLQRMWPHHGLGYLLVLFCTAHAWLSMQHGGMRQANIAGLWAATLAFLLLVFQAALGMLLRDPALPTRKLLRSWHYWTMLALVVLIAGHVWLNG